MLEHPQLALRVSKQVSGIHTLHSFPHFSLISLPATTAADVQRHLNVAIQNRVTFSTKV